MKTVVPDHYNSFFCIADKCKHSCCIGWEIDIDADTLHIYNNTREQFGIRLRNNIGYDGETAFFKLAENDRCPFLNERGLCDIITELGEDALCNICADHPRFRNFLSDRTEIGLGLCCEAAAKLILSHCEPTTLITLEYYCESEDCDPFEKEMLSKRDELFAIIKNRNLSLDERVSNILDTANATLPEISFDKWADVYTKLELLCPEWSDIITLLYKEEEPKSNTELDTAYEQLLFYFIYRHVTSAEDKQDLAARVAFSVLGYKIIRSLCERSGNSFDILCELARMYSSEIKYSEDNTAKLIKLLNAAQK